MQIRNVRYETAAYETVREFYTELFGLPVVHEGPDRFAVAVGETTVEFVRTDGDDEPFYHFTWDIPENRFDDAKAWLRDRTDLLKTDDGETTVYFETLDFHSVYFRDPAGNLGEFAARHTRDTTVDGPFDASAFVRVSEVGMPVRDVTGVIETLESDTGIGPHPGIEAVNPVITPVGNDYGMFPLIREWKEWFMANESARIHPVTVELADQPFDRYTIPDHPYTLVSGDSTG